MTSRRQPSNARFTTLTADEASRTLVARLQPRVDRLRDIPTRFGLSPYNTYLVWTRWSGGERGEGTERILKRTQILPSPRVEDLTGISLQLFSAGTIPVGSVRVTRISGSYAQDVLMGLTVPPDPLGSRASFIAGKGKVDPSALSVAADEVVDPYEFFYEIVEDGRSNQGREARRTRFRPLSNPFRRASEMDWSILLERVSEDMQRDGNPRTVLPGNRVDGEDE